MTNAAGAIQQKFAYDEYGNLTSAASTTGQTFRYTGRRFDAETGLYYYRARYYSPILGRFLQTDPVGYQDDLNFYAYIKNDPLNGTDPSGRCGEVQPVDGCVVTAKIPEQPSSSAGKINPGSLAEVNGHAIGGDGSKRNADFTRVKITDLGKSLQKIAVQSGSTLNKAIAESAIKGGPVSVKMTGVKAGGGFDGKTPLSQKGAIGRFSVSVSGVVSAGSNGGFNMNASVRGETDIQDYPADSARTGTASGLTEFGGAAQSFFGGQDYNIDFFGAQEINMVGP